MSDHTITSALAARGSTLIITNITKLVGVALAVNEAVVRDDVRDSVIALCALFVLGAQVAENSALRLIDRVFGTEPADRGTT
jgi:hypothetical protein